MQEKIAQEVQEALTARVEEIDFEELQDEDSSPLNQPVIEKDIGGEQSISEEERQKSWNIWKPEKDIKPIEELDPTQTSTPTDFRDHVESNVAKERSQEPLDAPEQEINTTTIDDTTDSAVTDAEFEMPLGQANQAADAILGIANNTLVLGGGYFVKISKHKEFYEFDEIIHVIDEQNDKNIQRIKLDKEDQILLRPLLAQVLRKKAKKLTPEQQLMGAVVSILMKKAQIVMEVRAENNLLEDRIIDIIREEKSKKTDIQEQEVDVTEYSETDTVSPPIKNEKEEASPQEPEHNIADLDMGDTDINTSIVEVAEELKTDT